MVGGNQGTVALLAILADHSSPWAPLSMLASTCCARGLNGAGAHHRAELADACMRHHAHAVTGATMPGKMTMDALHQRVAIPIPCG